MKKILLSCVTCLLALGLVTACDTEEEETAGGGDDSTTQESDTTTGDTGGSTTVTLTNYTISFSFVDEAGEAATLGDGYTLYLAGSWDSWAEDSWIACPYDEVTGYYTGTFASIVTGTYEYKGVSCETGDPSWAGEEVVTNNGGNATLTVTESNSGQVIPVTLVEAIYLSNYTLRFTFTGEAIPDYAVLYITGDFNGWALDALTEVEVTPDEGDGTVDTYDTTEEGTDPETEAIYTYTLESISVGEHKYKVIACYTGEEASWDDCVEVVTDEWGSDAKFEVVEASGDDYIHDIAYVIPSTVDFNEIVPVTLTNVTLSFTFYATDGVTPLGVVPSGYQISVAGSFDVSGSNWVLDANHVLTAAVDADEETPTGAYTYTISSITSGTYEFQFLYDKSGTPSWDHSLTSSISLKIGKGTSDSTIEYDIVTKYDDFDDIIHEKVEGVTSDFYIVLLDVSESTVESVSAATIVLGTGGTYFSGSSSVSSLTVGTTGTSGVTYLASPKGTATSWENDWFTFYDGSTGWDYKIETKNIDIPATDTGTCAVYVAYAHLDILLKTNTEQNEDAWDGYWETNVTSFETFVATL